MELISITEITKKIILEKYIKNFSISINFDCEENQIWTSATDFGNEGVFMWMANGKHVLLNNWANGRTQPKHSDERDCLAMFFVNSTLKFNDYFCNTNAYFLCEKIDCENN